MRRIICAFLVSAISLIVSASDGLKANFLGGRAVLVNGNLFWTYNKAGEPSKYGSGNALKLFTSAMASWEGACGVKFYFDGLTSRRAELSVIDGQSTFGWTNPVGGPDAYGVAYPKFSGGNIVEADMFIHPDNVAKPAEFLQGVMTHELGHALGLDHSSTQQSIMAGTKTVNDAATGVRYIPEPAMRFLQEDDIQACRSLYGSLRVAGFPWVEGSATEYYLPSVDRYFYTVSTDEKNAVERSGPDMQFMRTGHEFKPWTITTKPAGGVAVQRFYVPALGSHVFTLNAAEIAALRQNPSTFKDEGVAFYAIAPIAGNCTGGLTTVYRLYNGRADGNHRYVTRLATKSVMVSSGWRDEGVAFCTQ